jgi:hypothetical protein
VHGSDPKKRTPVKRGVSGNTFSLPDAAAVARGKAVVGNSRSWCIDRSGREREVDFKPGMPDTVRPVGEMFSE